MSTVPLPDPDGLTYDQRQSNLSKVDGDVTSIIPFLMGGIGLSAAGVFAGSVKAQSWLNAVIYALPIIAFAVSLCAVCITRFVHWWGTNTQTYTRVFETKRLFCKIAYVSIGLGAFLITVAFFVYIVRALLPL